MLIMMASTATVKVNFILLGMSALLVLDVRVDGRFDVICGVKNAAVLGLVRCTKLVRIFFGRMRDQHIIILLPNAGRVIRIKNWNWYYI